MRRLLVRNLIDTVAIEALGDLLLIKPGQAGVQRGQQLIVLTVPLLRNGHAQGCRGALAGHLACDGLGGMLIHRLASVVFVDAWMDQRVCGDRPR